MIALCNDVDQRSPHIRAPFAGLCRGRRRLIGAPTRGAQVRRTTKRANRKRGNTGGRKERRPAETLRLKQNILRDNYRMDGRRGGRGTRRAGGGTTWTSGGAGGGAKQKGENDGAVKIRTKGGAVEVIIIDK